MCAWKGVRQEDAAWNWQPVVFLDGTLVAATLGLIAGCCFYYYAAHDWPWLQLMAGTGLVGAVLALFRLNINRDWYFYVSLIGVFLLGLAAGLAVSDDDTRRVEDRFSWSWMNKPVWVTGIISETKPVASNPANEWLMIKPARIYAAGHVLERERVDVVVRKGRYDINQGQGMAAQVQLFLPQGPASDLARDYRVWEFVHAADPHYALRGYAYGRVEENFVDISSFDVGANNAWGFKPLDLLLNTLDKWRKQVGGALRGYGDGVVSAMLVGDWEGIPPRVNEAYRQSGMLHLLAISGFQLTLVGGGLYFMLRWLMSCWPWLALRINVRRWAALAGWLACVLYTLFVGADVGVLRACLMISLVFIAIIAGRMRGLLRTWWLVLAIMLLFMPSAVTRAGFVLSFTAVLALIGLAMAWGERKEHRYGDDGGRQIWKKIKLAVGAAVASSTVAGMATLPVLAAFFGQVSMVSVLANVVAVPAMVVLTWVGMLVLVLWPLGGVDGLASPFVGMMDVGMRGINMWAQIMAAVPFASVMVPKVFAWPLLVVCWASVVCVYKRWWDVLCLCVLAIGAVCVMGNRVTMAWPVLVAFDGTVSEGKAIVVHRDEVLADDCNEADGIIVAPGNGRSLCPEKMLELPFSWARMDKNGVWRVGKLGCERVWQKMSQDCQFDGR